MDDELEEREEHKFEEELKEPMKPKVDDEHENTE